MSRGQFHLTHLTILVRLSWPNLACMCTKVAYSLIHFTFFLSIHQRILTHTRQITTHWPKLFFFCALDVRGCMCDWSFQSESGCQCLIHRVIDHSFKYLLRLLNLWFVYNLEVETHISDVYFVSSDLYSIAKYKKDVILSTCNKNNDVILYTKHIKAC